jgi:hypothetical protein
MQKSLNAVFVERDAVGRIGRHGASRSLDGLRQAPVLLRFASLGRRQGRRPRRSSTFGLGCRLGLWSRSGGRGRPSFARRGRGAAVRCNALAKSIHYTDDIAWPRRLLSDLRGKTGLFGSNEFNYGVFIAVIELIGEEVACLSLNDDVRKVFHFCGQLKVRNVLKVVVLALSE